MSLLIFRFWTATPVDTGRKLNVHKTFRRRHGCLLNVLCTFNLSPVSTGIVLTFLKIGVNLPKDKALEIIPKYGRNETQS